MCDFGPLHQKNQGMGQELADISKILGKDQNRRNELSKMKGALNDAYEHQSSKSTQDHEVLKTKTSHDGNNTKCQ